MLGYNFLLGNHSASHWVGYPRTSHMQAEMICMKSFRKLLYAALLIVLAAFPAPAECLRCGNNLVDVGDEKIDVLRKCGEPTLVDQWEEEEILVRNPEFDRLGEVKRKRVYVPVEKWVYNFGPTRFIYIVIFKKGVVTEIQTGDHGF